MTALLVAAGWVAVSILAAAAWAYAATRLRPAPWHCPDSVPELFAEIGVDW